MEKMTIQDIKSDVINDRIGYSEAYEKIKKLPKPWQTKEWKEKRNQLIEDKCEQCGERDGIKVLQHLVHPKPFSIIRQSLLEEKIQEFKELHKVDATAFYVSPEEIEIFKRNKTVLRKACPKCKRLSFKERKIMLTKYSCDYCKHQFNEPSEIQYLPAMKKDIEKVDVRLFIETSKRINYELNTKRKIYEENKEEFGKKALLISIELHLQYISLQETVTFCKNCASRMDFSGQLLCYSCKEEYFDYDLYSNCFLCHKNGKMFINPFQIRIKELMENNFVDF